MKIAYGKLGRSIPLSLESASNVGGDIEVIMLMHKLVNAGHEVHIVGRNRGDTKDARITNHWADSGAFEGPVPTASRHRDAAFDLYETWLKHRMQRLPKFDAWVIWLGQHGSSVHPVPAIQDGKRGTYTNPMGSDVNYGYPIIAMCNHLGIRPIWLCPDPRNMVKFRDLWDPNQRTILAQFNTSKDNSFYDERDNKLRSGYTRYAYAGIELLAVPPATAPYIADARLRQPFGLLVNEGYSNLGSKGRLHLVKSWTRDIAPYELFGTWCDKSAGELAMLSIGDQPEGATTRTAIPVSLEGVHTTLQRWRCTVTFPATASGWSTAKPWECFRAGTVCFRHPDYDSQNHIYGRMDKDLSKFLTLTTPSSLKNRLEEMKFDSHWRQIVEAQHAFFLKSVDEMNGGARDVLQACYDCS